MSMWAEVVTLAVAAIAILGEVLHARRVRRLATLSFGPTSRPPIWTYLTPMLRVLSVAAVCWGLLSLGFIVESRRYDSQQEVPKGKEKHMVLLLDVSPSMTLEDAGTDGKQSRRMRAAEVVKSLFNRIPIRKYRISVIAVYSDAKPLIEDSKDVEVVRHIMEEIPLWHGFEPGETDLFAGLRYAARLARPWNPKSTTVVVVTDGDSVPPQGMPHMPVSVANVLVVGIGDASKGTFIHKHHSRQDISTLRQVANRLQGIYHNGNQKHLSSDTIQELMDNTRDDEAKEWTRREYAMLAVVVGSFVFAVLPLLLHYFGSRWRPGVRNMRRAEKRDGSRGKQVGQPGMKSATI